jgi:hypothetical protein
MASTSETTFGAKMRNAQDMLQIVATYADYTALRPQESIVEMNALIATIDTVNTTVNNSLQAYNIATKTRAAMFRTDAHSVIKLLSPIRKYNEALNGTDNLQTKQIITICNNIRNTKPVVVAATETAEEHKISQSEQSYGSLTKSFKDLIDTLTTISNYNPAAAYLKVAALQTMQTTLTNLNNTVTQNLTTLKVSRKSRNENYADLSERTKRIKANIAANYGNTSLEYKMIKSFKI